MKAVPRIAGFFFTPNKRMKTGVESISVAIQRVRGSFHEIAAMEYFSGREIRTLPCDSFAELFHLPIRLLAEGLEIVGEFRQGAISFDGAHN